MTDLILTCVGLVGVIAAIIAGIVLTQRSNAKKAAQLREQSRRAFEQDIERVGERIKREMEQERIDRINASEQIKSSDIITYCGADDGNTKLIDLKELRHQSKQKRS